MPRRVTRHCVSSRAQWIVTIAAADGVRLLEHGTLDCWEEVKAFCTVRRSEDLSTRIYFRRPGQERCEVWA